LAGMDSVTREGVIWEGSTLPSRSRLRLDDASSEWCGGDFAVTSLDVDSVGLSCGEEERWEGGEDGCDCGSRGCSASALGGCSV
jgi:hypothetical protein